MIEVLRNHITKRLGNDLDNLDKVLSAFKHITTKRNEQLLLELVIFFRNIMTTGALLAFAKFVSEDKRTIN